MLFYTFSIRAYHFIVRVVSPFNKKAKLFTNGRKHLIPKIEKDFTNNTSKTIWVHCASLGEFEQGRPIIESIKAQFPDKKIVITFFSPSGYEPRKNYAFADHVYYLPMDSKANAKRLVNAIKPELAIFVKYEFWLNFLNELHSQNIPTLLVSGIFRADQHFFKWYGNQFRKTLFYYKQIFLQNKESMQLLENIGLKNCQLAGDTRFDRVLEIAKNPTQFEEVKNFCGDSFVVLFGSSWPTDEEHLLRSLIRFKEKNIKIIIAPHNIERININQLQSLIKSRFPQFSYSIYTTWDKQQNGDILIMDTMGMLSSLYQYAHIACIGGGFEDGIHNILEALVYGTPVIFGPRYHKFQEANNAIDKEIAFSYSNQSEIDTIFDKLIGNLTLLESIKTKSKSYISENQGASSKIMKSIVEILS